jgi:MFS family permease
MEDATLGFDDAARPVRSRLARTLWYRQLNRYPDQRPRIGYLSIVVLSTIVLYYESYAPGSVAPQILSHYGMTFRYYVNITVVGSFFGAFAAIAAGLADKWGRANLVVYGVGVVGLMTLFAIPNAPNKLTFATLVVLIGCVEGVVLVATPALMRDFSPQMRRGTAMGFWTLGPVVGSLIVAVVASNTLSHLVAWQDQFTIAGIVGLVVFLMALFGLRELSPQLRDQLMVSLRDRALVEAKAKGLDVNRALNHPVRQMLRFDVLVSALAVSVLLLIYYTAVGFNVIYFETVFGFSTTQANSLGDWFWAFDALALVVTGVISDRLGVRKPFMLLGGIGAAVMTVIFLTLATHPHTSFSTFAIVLSLLAVFLGVSYAPWMASFTETVERHSPALVATGLAMWGWVLRIVVAVAFLIMPFVVSSVTPLVQDGAIGVQAGAILKADPLVGVVLAHPALFTELSKYPTASSIPPALLAKAVKEVGLTNLEAVGKDAKIPTEVAFFTTNAAALASVQKAAAVTKYQWQHWYWVCVGGEIVFLPAVFLLIGRWSPKKAKQDLDDFERRVQQELDELQAHNATTGITTP